MVEVDTRTSSADRSSDAGERGGTRTCGSLVCAREDASSQMMEAEGQQEPPECPDRPPDSRQYAATYRCVCGELISLLSGPAACGGCGRKYDSSVLREATAETAFFDEDAELRPVAGSPAGQETDQYLGKQLGHFQVLQRIGSGGMGSVYRALDQSLQRYVALKVIRSPREGTSQAVLERLFQEARAQARVNHPNVAHIYHVGIEDEVPFLAMELVGQDTLADRLKEGPLPFEAVIRYALQMAKALAHAAKYDIVHGDIKPGNVLLVDDRTIKISDFGLASHLSAPVGGNHVTAGTPDYMAPEAAAGQVDHRGDMYSLGVALFEMTFGRLPIRPSSTSLRERLRQLRETAVDFPDSWPVELPEAWKEVLERLLNKSPEARYSDYDELIGDLNRLRPVVLPNASPLLRGLAWFIDSLILAIPLLLVSLIFGAGPGDVIPLLRLQIVAASILGMCSLQAGWGTTPGKWLFQIRVVDQYGLRPARSVLASRGAFQFLWAWSLVVEDLFQFIRLPHLAFLVSVGALLFVLAEICCVLFQQGQSLHDRVFRTRVALDAADAR